MKKQILDIARFLFDDDDFIQLETYLNNKKYAKLAGFIEEHKEITDILLSFDNDNVELKYTLMKLEEIEEIFTNLYLGKEIINE
jgi:hypothetical protein